MTHSSRPFVSLCGENPGFIPARRAQVRRARSRVRDNSLLPVGCALRGGVMSFSGPNAWGRFDSAVGRRPASAGVTEPGVPMAFVDSGVWPRLAASLFDASICEAQGR